MLGFTTFDLVGISAVVDGGRNGIIVLSARLFRIPCSCARPVLFVSSPAGASRPRRWIKASLPRMLRYCCLGCACLIALGGPSTTFGFFGFAGIQMFLYAFELTVRGCIIPPVCLPRLGQEVIYGIDYDLDQEIAVGISEFPHRIAFSVFFACATLKYFRVAASRRP